MGCGASAQPSASDPGRDQLQETLEQIHAKQAELHALSVALGNEMAELRYVRTTIVKLSQVTHDMKCDFEMEKGIYEDVKEHIADQDAYDLREASVGFGTDESRMANIIVARLQENMILTDKKYQQKYNRTLEDQVRGENKSLMGLMTGSLTHFGRFLCYRCMPQPKRDAFLLHKCMAGFGCSDYILVEILSTRTNDELRAAAEVYAAEHDGEDMVERIMQETGGFGKKWYGKWIDTLVEFDRDESEEVPDNVEELAQELYDAGEGKWMGCDEQPFIDILCKANEATCQAIAEAYEGLENSKKTLAEAVEDKMGGDLEFAVLARVRSHHEFLAIRIYKACKGWGTDEECIGRVIGCLTKHDAWALRDFYDSYYAEEDAPFNDLTSLLRSELSGSFLDAILSIFETEVPKGHNLPETRYPREATKAADSFKQQVEAVYAPPVAQVKGREDLNGPLELLGIAGDEHFLMVEPYDYDIDAPEPPFQDKDRSHLFPPDPTELQEAENLLNQLNAECGQVSALTQATCTQKEALYPACFHAAGEMRFYDFYLGQTIKDNGCMTEFCASRDADYVHEAVEGWGTDEDKLIRTLCCLSKKQLRRVDEIYTERYGKSLRETCDGELAGFFEGTFKYFMQCMLTPNDELDAELLLDSMRGWGTNDALLCEIVCTRSDRELRAAQKVFERQNGKSLFAWVEGDTSGDYQEFLLACLRARRRDGEVDTAAAEQQAELLWNAGLSGGDLNADVFKTVLSQASAAQIAAIKDQFQQKYGKWMADAVKEHASTWTGGWERALMARILDKPTYYADALMKAMKGWGTDENALSRILGRNSKAEIKEIEKRYEELHGVTLHDAIVSETSGNFQKALLTMIFAEAPGMPVDPGAEGDQQAEE